MTYLPGAIDEWNGSSKSGHRYLVLLSVGRVFVYSCSCCQFSSRSKSQEALERFGRQVSRMNHTESPVCIPDRNAFLYLCRLKSFDFHQRV